MNEGRKTSRDSSLLVGEQAGSSAAEGLELVSTDLASVVRGQARPEYPGLEAHMGALLPLCADVCMQHRSGLSTASGFQCEQRLVPAQAVLLIPGLWRRNMHPKQQKTFFIVFLSV